MTGVTTGAMAGVTLLARTPLLAMAALAGLAVAVAGLGSVLRIEAGAPPAADLVQSRDLVFADRADGAVTVRDAATGWLVAVFQGENGFLRGTLRSFGRARRMDGVPSALPLHLARWSDGRLTLDDAKTGQHLELLAFGTDNARVFARILYDKEAAP